MSRRAKQRSSSNAAVQTPSDNDSFNMSIDHVPDDWVEAEKASPLDDDDGALLKRNTRFNTMPTGHQSPFISNVVALAAAFISGCVWYFSHALDMYRGPWAALAAGVFIAVAIRLTKIGQPPYRLFLAISTYLVTVMVVLVLLTRRDLSASFRPNLSFGDYEQALMRTRLRDVWYLTALGLGGFLTGVIAFVSPGKR